MAFLCFILIYPLWILIHVIHNGIFFVLQVLKQKLETAGDVELGLRSKLDKAVEENEDLRFEVSFIKTTASQ